MIALALNLCAVSSNVPIDDTIPHDLLISAISHIAEADLNLAVIKSTHPLLAAAMGVNLVNRLWFHF